MEGLISNIKNQNKNSKTIIKLEEYEKEFVFPIYYHPIVMQDFIFLVDEKDIVVKKPSFSLGGPVVEFSSLKKESL